MVIYLAEVQQSTHLGGARHIQHSQHVPVRRTVTRQCTMCFSPSSPSSSWTSSSWQCTICWSPSSSSTASSIKQEMYCTSPPSSSCASSLPSLVSKSPRYAPGHQHCQGCSWSPSCPLSFVITCLKVRSCRPPRWLTFTFSLSWTSEPPLNLNVNNR